MCGATSAARTGLFLRHRIATSHRQTGKQLTRSERAFLQEVIEPLSDQFRRVMIVAHGALNKGLMCYIEGNDNAHYWGEGLQNNCEAAIFTVDANGWQKIK